MKKPLAVRLLGVIIFFLIGNLVWTGSLTSISTAFAASNDCGANVAPGVWKEFDCYNLAAIGKTTNADPFTPSWQLVGGYWQWGKKGPNPSEWHNTSTSHFAHGPTGPGAGEANAGELSVWDHTDAPDGAWSTKSQAIYYLLDQDADINYIDVDGDGVVDLLARINTNGLRFSIDGVVHVVEFDQQLLIDGSILNHDDFVAALQDSLDALIAAGTVPADTTLTVDTTMIRTTFLDDGSVSSDIPAIVLETETSSVLDSVGFKWVEDFYGEYNVYGRLDQGSEEDPCPSGFRVPSQRQWEGVTKNNIQLSVGTWSNSVTNYSSARYFGSDLMLPAAGYRGDINGVLNYRGYYGYYWSGSQDTSGNAWNLYTNNSEAGMASNKRRYGFSVRCIAEETALEERRDQTITFSPHPDNLSIGSISYLSATASSGLAVVFSSLTPDVCSVSGMEVSGLELGICNVTADQDGNSIYEPATTVTHDIAVIKADQIIHFTTYPKKLFIGGTAYLSATTSSDLAVVFSSLTPDVCSVSGMEVSGLELGICNVTADQMGSAVYNPAPTVIRNFTVTEEVNFFLTRSSPNLTVSAGAQAFVYGTALPNDITLETGAKAELINFSGSNNIEFQSDANLFTVSRSGTVVTFEGSDGTILKIPATTDIQTISFNEEESRVLQIHNNQVMLDDQVIDINKVPIAANYLTYLTMTEVSKLYVAIFNLASTGQANISWQESGADMSSTANAMLDSDFYNSYFGAGQDSDQAFVEQIYLNTLAKTADDDPDGIAFWVRQLEAGASRGELVANLVDVIENYGPDGANYDPDDVATVAAYNQFVNRVEVSNYMAANVQNPPANYAQSTAFDADLVVTDEVATVTQAKRLIDIMSGL